MPEPLAIPFDKKLACKVKEAVAVSGMGKTKFFALLKSGEIKSTKVGSMRLVNVPSLLDFLGLSTNQSTNEPRIQANRREQLRTKKPKLNHLKQ